MRQGENKGVDIKGDGQGMQQVGERGEIHKGFWWRNLKQDDSLEHSSTNGRIILKLIYKK
jgi:hypothetical protein